MHFLVADGQQTIVDIVETATTEAVLDLGRHRCTTRNDSFNGNATLAATLLFSEMMANPEPSFFASGLTRTVFGTTWRRQHDRYIVRCVLKDMGVTVTSETLYFGEQVTMVKFGHTTYAVVDSFIPFPEKQKELFNGLRHLCDAPLTGIVWAAEKANALITETACWPSGHKDPMQKRSCASAAIAAHWATGLSEVVQASGQKIVVTSTPTATTIESDVVIVR